MKLTDVTSVGRTIDPHYPTNRAIAILTLLITVAAALWQRLSAGQPWLASATWGLQAGLTIFLTWALCRELDPDHPLGAFLAAALALPTLYLWGLPQLNVAVWLIIVTRVVNRTVGLPAGLLDALGLLAFSTWLSWQGNWGFGAVTALAFLLDALLPHPARRHLLFALLTAVATVVAAFLGTAPAPSGALSPTGGLVALALSLPFLPVIIASRSIESLGDHTDQPLTPTRVQTAQALALLIGIETALLGGPSAILQLTPLWAATLGATLTWLTKNLLTHLPSRQP